MTSTATLPPEWFQFPYAWHTLQGIALDQGHTVKVGYGDDGKMNLHCQHCRCSLRLDNGIIRERTLLDTPCAWIGENLRP